MINLMQAGLDVQQAIIDSNKSAKVYEIRFVDVTHPCFMGALQREAHHLGLILQCNQDTKHTKQTLMCKKLLPGFQPIRSGYKQNPDDFTPEAA